MKNPYIGINLDTKEKQLEAVKRYGNNIKLCTLIITNKC